MRREVSGLKKFQLCLVAGARSEALGLMMPPSDFHLTILASASSSYTTCGATEDDGDGDDDDGEDGDYGDDDDGDMIIIFLLHNMWSH